MVTLGVLFILTLISKRFGLWYFLATCKDQGTVSEPALGFQLPMSQEVSGFCQKSDMQRPGRVSLETHILAIFVLDAGLTRHSG